MTDRPSSETPTSHASTADADDVREYGDPRQEERERRAAEADGVSRDQLERVFARRREQQRLEERRRAADPHTLQPVGAVAIHEFDGTCRLCGSAFRYQGVAVVLPNMDPRPAFAPRRVCDSPPCVATAQAEQDAADLEAARAQRRDLLEQARRRYVEQVPPQYHERAAIEPACDAHLIPELQAWEPGQSVYLHGPSGHGKSHQAACLVRRSLLAGHDVRWVSARRLVQDTLEAIRRKADKPWIIANPCGVRTLVVNDAYAETATMFACGLLGDLYDARYEAGMSIVWTSNVAPSQITNTVDGNRRDAATITTELERQRGRILEMTAPGRGIMHRHVQRDWRAALAAGEDLT